MCLHSLYTWHLQVLSRIQLERLQCFPRLPSWYNSRPTIVCRPCLSFASNSKSLLIELTGVLNINSFPSHTTFLQLTNLSISTTWFLFNTVTTSVLHLQSLFIYSLSCLSTSPFFWRSQIVFHHCSMEWTVRRTLRALPNTVSFNFTSYHTWQFIIFTVTTLIFT